MKIDSGMAIVIIAVLVFYLRLIVLQREAARRMRKQASKGTGKTASKSKKTSNPKKASNQVQPSKKGKTAKAEPQPAPIRSILSAKKLDLAIAGIGLLAVVVGSLAYMSVLSYPVLQAYWWLPTSLGILAFGSAFKLPE